VTPEEFQTLSVLDAVSLNKKASQRDLSRATGINLAKVNNLLRKLTQKGFVKLRNVSRNPNKLGYLYILTPKGLSEKSRLTIRFAAKTWAEYSQTLERFRESLLELAETGAKRVVLLGNNEVTDMLIQASKGVEGLSIVGVFDTNGAGRVKHGVPCIEDLKATEFDWAIPCENCAKDLKAMVLKMGLPRDKIWLIRRRLSRKFCKNIYQSSCQKKK